MTVSEQGKDDETHHINKYHVQQELDKAPEVNT